MMLVYNSNIWKDRIKQAYILNHDQLKNKGKADSYICKHNVHLYGYCSCINCIFDFID